MRMKKYKKKINHTKEESVEVGVYTSANLKI